MIPHFKCMKDRFDMLVVFTGRGLQGVLFPLCAMPRHVEHICLNVGIQATSELLTENARFALADVVVLD